MYKKRLWYLIAVSTVIRLVVASIIGLGNDEVYYYTYAMHLQQNYFDHPPGVALLIRLFTCNLYFTQEVFLRLGPILFAATGTWLCFTIGRRIRNEATGWYAALLYNASIYSSVIAGLFILPDSPQVVFWLAALLAMIKLTNAYKSNNKATYGQWLLFGLLAGICTMCKVHGIFLWGGLGLYMLFYERKMFLHPGFYTAVLLSLAIVSPIVTWNIHNHFITWRYHSQRVEVQHFSLNTDGFIQAVLGQIFYNNPLNVFLLVAALIAARKTKLGSSQIHRLLLLTGLPIILFVTGISLLRDVLPHWSGPGFVTVTFISAAFLDEKLANQPKSVFRGILKGSIALTIVLIVAGTAAIELYPGTIGSKDALKYGDGDFTLDMYGWKQFSGDFTTWEKEAAAQKQIPAGINFVCNKWFPAAHILYYVALPLHKTVTGVGNLDDLHQFVWQNHYQPVLAIGDSALCIIPSNYYADVQKDYGKYFDAVTPLKTFTSFRGGKPVRYFDVYLLRGYKGNDESRVYRVE